MVTLVVLGSERLESEAGTVELPRDVEVSRNEHRLSVRAVSFSDEPTLCRLPGRGIRRARYLRGSLPPRQLGPEVVTIGKRTLVVCGATGKQGGAVLDSLAADGRWIWSPSRAVPMARAPKLSGHEVWRSVRPTSMTAGLLIAAFAGADSAYGLSTPETADGKVDSDLDRRQGINVAEAALAAGVDHLVMSTVLYVEDGQEKSLDYIRPKFETETYVAQKGIPHTFIRPASFMDEIGGEFLPARKGVIIGQADNDTKIPYAACRDIGRLAALAFADPARFLGRRVNLIGDFLSGDELTRVTGRPHRHKAPPIAAMWVIAREWIPLRRHFERWGRPPHPPALMEWIEESKRLLPDILSFEAYLRTIGFGTGEATST
jgi:uncharacterized protein YbjT (DUF2867 family)